jgi:hypothetical protein
MFTLLEKTYFVQGVCCKRHMLICFRPTVQFIYGSCSSLLAIQAEPRGELKPIPTKGHVHWILFKGYTYSMSFVHSLEIKSPTLSLLHPSFYRSKMKSHVSIVLHFAIIQSPEIQGIIFSTFGRRLQKM